MVEKTSKSVAGKNDKDVRSSSSGLLPSLLVVLLIAFMVIIPYVVIQKFDEYFQGLRSEVDSIWEMGEHLESVSNKLNALVKNLEAPSGVDTLTSEQARKFQMLKAMYAIEKDLKDGNDLCAPIKRLGEYEVYSTQALKDLLFEVVEFVCRGRKNLADLKTSELKMPSDAELVGILKQAVKIKQKTTEAKEQVQRDSSNITYNLNMSNFVKITNVEEAAILMHLSTAIQAISQDCVDLAITSLDGLIGKLPDNEDLKQVKKALEFRKGLQKLLAQLREKIVYTSAQ